MLLNGLISQRNSFLSFSSHAFSTLLCLHWNLFPGGCDLFDSLTVFSRNVHHFSSRVSSLLEETKAVTLCPFLWQPPDNTEQTQFFGNKICPAASRTRGQGPTLGMWLPSRLPLSQGKQCYKGKPNARAGLPVLSCLFLALVFTGC